ncbi:MAG: biotin--[acetyl-CoA-carboxylase] ligase [Deltaproteobacteria bacterium RIFOXYD12_FULL_57_12]|nr:MAG: biotin--[acetyl-CoA-carboxylase] ligase [Deltaproteobacteria bacterium RIFOXYD12_FULL_57_12]
MDACEFPLTWLATTHSTNTLAMQMAAEGALAWSVVAADTQTHGRGRLQRAWVSPPGSGLYFSLILRPNLPLPDFPRITLAAAVAVCWAIEAMGILTPGIKWPNDLLVAGRKLGGILAETETLSGSQPATRTAVVLGIGINVNATQEAFPAKLQSRITSLFLCSGKTYSRHELLGSIVRQLRVAVGALERGESAKILSEWRQRDALLGKTLTWLTAAGRSVTGEALGINDAGLYHIRDSFGVIHEVLSGDLNPIMG